jgi:hypothetical protein
MRLATIAVASMAAAIGLFHGLSDPGRRLYSAVYESFERTRIESSARERFSFICRYVYADVLKSYDCESKAMLRWRLEARHIHPDEGLADRVINRMFESDRDRQARERAEFLGYRYEAP